MMEINIDSHVDDVLRELEQRIPVALEDCGLAAEGYAKRLCAVDTGLLRNSITHALDGESPAITEYTDNPGVQRGSYSGVMPKQTNGRAVYLGTNVEYAAYVELGTTRTKEQPFIKPAIVDHVEDYKKIIESRLNG